jgi:hypothetical protein
MGLRHLPCSTLAPPPVQRFAPTDAQLRRSPPLYPRSRERHDRCCKPLLGPLGFLFTHSFQHHVSTEELLAAAAPSTRHQCHLDWCAIQDTCATRVSRQQDSSANASWRLWLTFCVSLGIDLVCKPSDDAIPLLQLFVAQRSWTGTVAPGRQPVRARTEENALRAVGHALAWLGAPDPRLNVHGAVD